MYRRVARVESEQAERLRHGHAPHGKAVNEFIRHAPASVSLSDMKHGGSITMSIE
jgi:hypothetical protein